MNKGAKEVMVSVIVTAYNHDKYIRQTLESVFMQKGVDFEVLLADDCSTDNTLQIMREYNQKYPRISRILPKSQNLGMCLNMYDSFRQARGRYIAICEGDDYWTDELKLKKQSDLLDANQQYSGVFNFFEWLYENGQLTPDPLHSKLIKNKHFEIHIEDLINQNVIGNLSTCVFRTKLIQKIPKLIFKKYFIADWLIGLLLTDSYGPLCLLPEKMSVYRKHKRGQWTGMNWEEGEFQTVKAAVLYHHLLGFKYERDLRKYLDNYRKRYYEIKESSGLDKLNKYRKIFRFQAYFLSISTLTLVLGLILSKIL